MLMTTKNKVKYILENKSEVIPKERTLLLLIIYLERGETFGFI